MNRKVLGAALLALLFFALCLQGARWQFDRHEVRHAKNELIRANIAKPPISERQLSELPRDESAWRTIEISGRFVPENEILVRNRYHDGQYGFGVVTLFESELGKRYWVDRGWVIAGPDALTPPKTRSVDTSLVSITARVRVEDIESQVSGTVFAVPGSNGQSRLTKWDQESDLKTESFYLDLISSNLENFNPEVPTSLPPLSDGPHLAYSLQWLLFAGLVVFGFFLVVREERRAIR